MIDNQLLKRDLAAALNAHIELLHEVELIESEHMDAFTFMMRSFGFMLRKAPDALLTEDEDTLYYMLFQYYSLLTELKYNLLLNFPYARLQEKTLVEVVKTFPTTYELEMKAWWEQHTGLKVEETKQTIAIKEFNY
ncbi:hypothetical protein ACSFB8_08760 [Enterococcus faecalis]